MRKHKTLKPKRLWKWVTPGTIHENGGVGDWTSALKLPSAFAEIRLEAAWYVQKVVSSLQGLNEKLA